MSVLFILRNLSHLPKCCSLLPKSNFHSSQVLKLFSPSALGIDQYTQTRQRIGGQFVNLKQKFLMKMNEFIEDDPKNMIFSEDLKNMAHIAEKEDLPLVNKMIKKFNKQSSEYRFGSFVFGTVIMRMFHYLNAPDEALQCYNEAKSTPFFDQQTSYQILMDLLYRNARYDDVLQVFEDLKKKQLNMIKFPKYPVVLVMAACYKQNTTESLKYASQVITEMNETGSFLLRKSAAFIAALALNQGAPHIAMEVVSSQQQHYVTIRNIKAIALAESGRVDEALIVLRSVLDIDIPSQKDKHTYLSETVEKVRAAVVQSNSKDLKHEFNLIEKALKERNLINQQSLDEMLTKEFQAQRMPQDSNRDLLHASYQGFKRPPQTRRRDISY